MTTLEDVEITDMKDFQLLIDEGNSVNYLYELRGRLYDRNDLSETQLEYWDMQLSRRINVVVFDSSISKYLSDPPGR